MRATATMVIVLVGCGSGAPAPETPDGAIDAGKTEVEVGKTDATVLDAPADASGPLADAAPASDLDPAQQACASYAERFCDERSRCDRYGLAAVWGDLDVCRERRMTACLVQYTAPGSTWTPADQQACNAALVGRDCLAAITTTPAACRKAGSLPAGSPCGIDVQCQGGLCLNRTADPCGTCSERQPAGGPCTRFGLECEAGFGCTDKHVCGPRQRLGEACDAGHECQLDLACVGLAPGGGGTGTCQRAHGVGEPCGPLVGGCATIPDQLTCRSTAEMTWTCQPEPPFAAPGQQCGFGAGQPDVRCRGFDDCVDGGDKSFCRAALTDGSPCSAGSSASCRVGSHCRGGVCRFDDPTLCR
jgi:hypothetical protein